MFSEKSEILIPYTLPSFHEGKDTYVDLYAMDPLSGQLKRKKYCLNRIKGKRNRRKQGKLLISIITAKLLKGWSPWVRDVSTRQAEDVNCIFERYAQYIEGLNRCKTMKNKTFVDYSSRLRTLREYHDKSKGLAIFAYHLDTAFFSDFLDYILLDRESSACTRNNYRTWLSSFCSWCVEKKYMDENPIEKISVLKEGEKTRKEIPEEELKRMKVYLERENKHFLLACMFEYYTFIRPDELSFVKLRDINILKQEVFIHAEHAKNRKDAVVALNKNIILMMVDLGIFDSPGDFYLFGRDFKPAKKKADSRIFREYFAKMRKKLNWPMHYQFYSLKDTGIKAMANAEGVVVARDQARHSDISITNKYLQQDLLEAPDEAKAFEGVL